MSGLTDSMPDGTTTILTPRLLLRAAHPNDAEALYLCFSDAEVMRYWSTLPHKSIEETEAWLSKMLDSKSTNGITDFVITLRNNDNQPQSTSSSAPPPPDRSPVKTLSLSLAAAGPAIGKIGIYAPLTPSRSGEIGFMLSRTYHRRGLASEALAAVLEYLFEERGVEGITTDVDPRNEASGGVLEKHGFAVTGRGERTWEIGGVWVDSEYRGLRRQGWEGRSRGVPGTGRGIVEGP